MCYKGPRLSRTISPKQATKLAGMLNFPGQAVGTFSSVFSRLVQILKSYFYGSSRLAAQAVKPVSYLARSTPVSSPGAW